MSDNGNNVQWVLNGETVESPAGTTIFEACKAHGVELPHFCYHPGLSIAGNCRMCLVETNRSPKPAISCSERIAEGLEVQTHSEMAVEAREGVMEFELINHPLDCPVCDKAGECVLQDYSYEHGPDRSRFLDDKNIRHTKRLGPTIEIWGNRCIVCTRCVRFCDEISGTGELCVVERGDRSVVDVFPGVPIDNPLAGNTIDICPVGALIGSDFKFNSRVWYLDGTESVCGGCARGCNVNVHSLDGYVKRLTPRENADVNEWWMCDEGRYGWRYAHADNRIRDARVAGESVNDKQATEKVGALLSEAREGKKSVAFLVDPFMTCEEVGLVKSLADSTPGASIGAWGPDSGVAQSFPGGFTISAEKAPNRVGVEVILGKEAFGSDASAIKKALESGKVDLLIAVVSDPSGSMPDEWKNTLSKAKSRAVFALNDGDWTKGADVVIPAASAFEKEGTWVNEDGRLQRVRSSVDPGTATPGTVSGQESPPALLRPRSELSLLQEVQIQIGDRQRLLSATGVFRELANSVAAFEGQTHRDITAQGVPLPGYSREAVGSGGDA